MEFASKPSESVLVPIELVTGSTPRIEITKENDHELDDAPIFSPSMGNLSQYARSTPLSKHSTPSFQTAPGLSPGNLHDACRNLYVDTPTRLPAQATSASLVSRSTSNNLLTPKRHNQRLLQRALHNQSASVTSRQDENKMSADKPSPVIETRILQRRDENAPVNGTENQVSKKKGRSIPFIGRSDSTKRQKRDSYLNIERDNSTSELNKSMSSLKLLHQKRNSMGSVSMLIQDRIRKLEGRERPMSQYAGKSSQEMKENVSPDEEIEHVFGRTPSQARTASNTGVVAER